MNEIFPNSHPRSAPNTLRTAVKLTTLGVSITDVRRDETSGVGAEESSNTLYVNQYISSPPEYKLIPEFLAKNEDTRTGPMPQCVDKHCDNTHTFN